MRNFRLPLNRRAGQWAALGGVLLMLSLLISAHAQFGRRRPGRNGGGWESENAERYRQQEMMKKAIDPDFTEDVFTFARLKFDSDGGGRERAWHDDTPNADLMLTYRLFEATSLKVRPGVNYIDITTKDLANYPFVYMAGSGGASLNEEESLAMRQYLLNGGFLMVDDFWGDDDWDHFYGQLKKIFPNREPELLSLTNQIFHIVYPFKKQPQIPSVGHFFSTHQSYDYGFDYSRMNHDPHYFGVYDDKRRMMMLICHNNHFGDGWEHEGDDPTYFNIFSMPMGYPMLINILTYTMSH